MTNKSLLPPNATKLERNISTATKFNLPIPIRTLWNANTCPTHLLPYLAWQYSVDRWDEKWSEKTKRKVINESYAIHQKKGTKAAIRQAVEPFGYLIKLTEWWQNNQAPGTFSLEIGVLEQGITEETYQELTRIIDDVKPVSKHITGLAICLDTKGRTNIGCTTFDGNTLTIYPYIAENITTTTNTYTGIGIHIIDTVRVTP